MTLAGVGRGVLSIHPSTSIAPCDVVLRSVVTSRATVTSTESSRCAAAAWWALGPMATTSAARSGSSVTVLRM